MRAPALLAGLALLVAGTGLIAAPATAAIVHVMLVGNDTSDCGTIGPGTFKPCKTLAKGIERAGAGGTVYFDLPGDYGRAVVTKSVHIFGRSSPGGGTLGPTGTCLVINAGANDVVTITNWTCDEQGAVSHGLVFNSGGVLILDNVSIRNGAGGTCGVLFQPNSAATLLMRNSSVSGYGTSGVGGGVCMIPRSGAAARGWLSNVNLTHNRNALVSTSNSNAAIRIGLSEGDAAGNLSSGIRSSGANSIVYVRASSVRGNAVGLSRVTSGQIISLGSNLVTGNTTNGTFSSTIAPN